MTTPEERRTYARPRWVPRPLLALLLIAMFTAVGGVIWAIAYARNRMAALEYIHSLDGDADSNPPSWCSRWSEAPKWFQSVNTVAIWDPVTSLRPLAPLHELNALVCIRAEIDDSEMRHIRNFRKLETLTLLNSRYSDRGLAEIGNCAQLSFLETESPLITDAGLKPLRHLRLKSLMLRGPGITDAGMADLACIAERAEFFGLVDARVTDVGVKHLAGLPMTVLLLRGARITDAGLRELSGLKLQGLYLCNTQITDEGLKHLAGMPLETLWLRNTRITDAGLKHLLTLPLEDLNLSGTQITDAGLNELPLHTLRTVDLTRTAVTFEGLLQARGLVSLKEVKLSDPQFSREEVIRLIDAGLKMALIDPAKENDWWNDF